MLIISDVKRHIYGVKVYGTNREISVCKNFVESVHNNNVNLSGYTLLADKDYFDASFMEFLSNNNINGLIAPRENPIRCKQKRESRFTIDDFEYKEEGFYLCPNGCFLRAKSINNKKSKNPSISYYAKKSDCDICKYRLKCLPNKGKKTKYRTISRNIKSNFIDDMRQKMEIEENKKLYKKRLGVIEPIFGSIKDEKQCNIHRFVLKGELKVNIEAMLMVIASILCLNNKNIPFFVIFLNIKLFNNTKLNSHSKSN